MDILLTTGTGEGATAQAALDAALFDAGVANANLIRLRPMLPPASVVQRVRYMTPRAEIGDRLYVAIAERAVTQPGQHAFAGLGWTQEAPSGRGLLVPGEGASRAEVEAGLRASLDSMVALRVAPHGRIDVEIAGIECKERPVCAVAIAVFRAESWDAARRAP